MSDDRSERLRRKRRSVKDKQEETAEESESDNSSKTSEPSEASQTSDPNGTEETSQSSGSVKEENVGVYMYLPESQRDEVRYQFKRLSAEYEREFGEELEKNREFYPLLVQYGLDSLDSWDVQDVKDRLEVLGVQK